MNIAVLDNLRSVYNVGSIFRTANACGITHIILCGTTPTPLDKKGVPRKDFAKVALGAEDLVSWEYKDSTLEALEELQEKGYYTIAFEQDKRAIDYKEVSIQGKDDVAFIVGPEVTGIEEEILTMCDVIAEIKMLGTKESLNVTIAFGIGVYRILGI
jgi:tRNA G18 (ribose-2'-O)-methylase SpoU